MKKLIITLLFLVPILCFGQTFKYKKYVNKKGVLFNKARIDTGKFKISLKPHGGQYILTLEGDIYHCTGTSTRLHCGAFTVIKDRDRVEVKRITLGEGTEVITYTK